MNKFLPKLFALLSGLCTSPLAIAAATTPPPPTLRKSPAAWMGMGLMFVLFGIVIAISLMSSKRGHQD